MLHRGIKVSHVPALFWKGIPYTSIDVSAMPWLECVTQPTPSEGRRISVSGQKGRSMYTAAERLHLESLSNRTVDQS